MTSLLGGQTSEIIKALENRLVQGGPLLYRLVHTGQHYDSNLSGLFFEQLGIPTPDINLEAGSGSQATQTSEIMTRYEALLIEKTSQLCLVVGDVTSTMACAITAQKLCIPVAHVEGGIRSGDWSMPEEINRLVTDSITNWFFTTSEFANSNLLNAGVEKERIFYVGNTMIDTLLDNLDRLIKPTFWEELDLSAHNYFVMTLHRPVNVDQKDQLIHLLKAIDAGARNIPVLFPVHPRTSKTLQDLIELPDLIKLVEPQPYLEFNYLVRHAKAVITDSGGVTEETTVLGIPCLTLRDTTERPETVSIGTNELIGTNPSALKPAMERLFDGQWKSGSVPEKWDGNTGKRIVAHLEQLLTNS